MLDMFFDSFLNNWFALGRNLRLISACLKIILWPEYIFISNLVTDLFCLWLFVLFCEFELLDVGLFYFGLLAQGWFFLFKWTYSLCYGLGSLGWRLLNSFVRAAFQSWVLCALYWRFLHCDTAICHVGNAFVLVVVHQTVPLLEFAFAYFRFSRLWVVWTFAYYTVIDVTFLLLSWLMLKFLWLFGLIVIVGVEIASTGTEVDWRGSLSFSSVLNFLLRLRLGFLMVAGWS